MLEHTLSSEPKKSEYGKKKELAFIDKELGKDGLDLFRWIFADNKKDLVRDFFDQPIVRMLWPLLLDKFSFNFKKLQAK